MLWILFVFMVLMFVHKVLLYSLDRPCCCADPLSRPVPPPSTIYTEVLGSLLEARERPTVRLPHCLHRRFKTPGARVKREAHMPYKRSTGGAARKNR